MCIVYFIFLFAVIMVCARLFVISDSGSEANYVLSGQYTRRMDIAERHGFIFDRNGVILDHIQNGYILFVDPSREDASEYYETAEKLSDATDMQESYFIEKLFSGAPFTVAAKSETKDNTVFCYEKYDSTDGEFLCHVLGYNDSEGNGMSGICKAYSEFLSEYTSGEVFARYEADATGAVMNDTSAEIHDSGYTEENGIYLTIDADIQKIAEEISNEVLDMGAVVIQDTVSGEILALVSRPAYDRGNVAEYLLSERGELLNRCFMGYTPGSVFKTVVAVCALEEDSGYADKKYECTGVIDVSGEKIKCHNILGHGELDMKEAFAQSCNPYFIDLGLTVGIDNILSEVKKLGVGAYDSINLIPVSEGNLPTEGLNFPAQVANTSVGQGDVLLTPVQVCSIMSTAATGIYHKPSIVSKLVSYGEETEYGGTEGTRVISEKTVFALGEMLRSCVEDGTGYRAKSDIVNISGKTATAQSGQIKDDKEVIHSWFAGYFPSENPKYTMCVLCDGNGEENENPAVIFKKIAELISENE